MQQSQSPENFISDNVFTGTPVTRLHEPEGASEISSPHTASTDTAFPIEDTEVINVIEEKIVIEKQQVETGKVRIRKTITEEMHSVSVPIVNDEYEITRIEVPQKTLLTPPEPVRQEGDTTIISVIREITVVEKRYEVIEEIHVTRHKTELPLVHEISLRKEHVHVDRQTIDR